MWKRCRQKPLEAGKTAPGFLLNALDGNQVTLSETLSKGPALLAFFKIGCPVCQMTFPFLERLAANSTLQLVGISQDDAVLTGKFNTRFGVTFSTLLDSAAENYPASNAYGIISVPSFFLVEPDGSISKAFQGFSKRDLEEVGHRVGVIPFQRDDKVPEFRPG